MSNQTILILDFGSQYTQLIARRIRELNVYCEIYPFDKFPLLSDEIKAIILSGSPSSVLLEDAPNIELSIFRNSIPILGICYGAQLIAKHAGGKILPSNIREFGRAALTPKQNEKSLFDKIKTSDVWMSHGDTIVELPETQFQILASTKDVEIAAFKIKNEPTYGIQFHPEVSHTTYGKQFLKNFIIKIAKCSQDWTPNLFLKNKIGELKKQLHVGDVVMGLSGGVDSSVAAVIIQRAIGDRLKCVFVDNGLLRKNEFAEVLDLYHNMGLNIETVNARERFYKALKNITDPEEKRKTIGKVFIEVFEQQAKSFNNVMWLAQGTIYPDIIESVSVNGPSVTIKSHHNVGGLPEKMNLKVVEPLSSLFKDEVREVGKVLNISQDILGRHPFPGPGLGIRILGEVSEQKIKILQEVDFIFVQSLKKHNLYNKIWQAGAILLPINSVGVMGDERTYEQVVAIRAVTSSDGMTADWFDFSHKFLKNLSNEIINKVKGVNRVVYDISSKPPATIEWE